MFGDRCNTHTHTHTHTHTCMHACMRTHAHPPIRARARTHAQTAMFCDRRNAHTCTHTRRRARAPAHPPTHTHTHTHTHWQIYAQRAHAHARARARAHKTPCDGRDSLSANRTVSRIKTLLVLIVFEPLIHIHTVSTEPQNFGWLAAQPARGARPLPSNSFPRDDLVGPPAPPLDTRLGGVGSAGRRMAPPPIPARLFYPPTGRKLRGAALRGGRNG